jgi:hypothetical protein
LNKGKAKHFIMGAAVSKPGSKPGSKPAQTPSTSTPTKTHSIFFLHWDHEHEVLAVPDSEISDTDRQGYEFATWARSDRWVYLKHPDLLPRFLSVCEKFGDLDFEPGSPLCTLNRKYSLGHRIGPDSRSVASSLTATHYYKFRVHGGYLPASKFDEPTDRKIPHSVISRHRTQLDYIFVLTPEPKSPESRPETKTAASESESESDTDTDDDMPALEEPPGPKPNPSLIEIPVDWSEILVELLETDPLGGFATCFIALFLLVGFLWFLVQCIARES